MRQDAAFEKGVELVPHKLRQVGANCRLSLLEEGGGLLLHQAVQRGLLRAHCCGDPSGGLGVYATGCFGTMNSRRRMSQKG